VTDSDYRADGGNNYSLFSLKKKDSASSGTGPSQEQLPQLRL